MLGSIAGDIIGSVYERHGITTKKFPLFRESSHFTDDTVLTVATAHCLLTGSGYTETYRRFGQDHPNRGYGGSFRKWVFNPERGPYNSFGNGSAMRVSPVGFACGSIEDVLAEARRSAEVTHNHPEGIKGAEAVALAVYLARTGADKSEIKREIMGRFGYRLHRKLDDIREDYGFDVTCQGSVPEAIIAFLEADGVEDAIRNAVSLGGDADTQACIAGGIAEAFHGGVPPAIEAEVRGRLSEDFLATIYAFYTRFINKAP
jgi:ADP-ribosylglycohydrolase